MTGNAERMKKHYQSLHRPFCTMKTYRLQQNHQKYRNLPSQRQNKDEEKLDNLVGKFFFANNISFCSC